MKNKSEIAFIIQGRLNSTRLPKKMIKKFKNGKCLLEIAIEKFCDNLEIPNEQVYVSVGEKELIDIAEKYPVNIYKRSKKSFLFENNLKDIFEWHKDLSKKFKYYFMINACAPLLTNDTINSFLNHYIESKFDGLFGVIEKRSIAWNSNLEIIGNNSSGTLNTKHANKIYLPGHILYAGKIENIEKNIHMGTFLKTNDPELFIIHNELECWDIDYDWQFQVANSII